MTAQEKVRAFSERIIPHMQEIGISAFVLAGYMDEGDGKVKRITLGANGGNPAMEDGLRAMNEVAAEWGQGLL